MDKVLLDTTVLCIILTANKDDFPTRLGKIEIIRPQAYYEYLVTITGDV